MAKSDSAKDKHKDKPKSKPAAHGAHGAPEKKAKPKDKVPKQTAEEKAASEVAAAEAKEKVKVAPRPPSDPRLKFLKKFHGKFLPRGPLRDRHKALMQRWDSGEDHGGVTAAELKSLHEDWKTARQKPVKAVRVS